MDIKGRAGNEHWTMGSPRKNCSHHPPFSQQAVFSQTKSREQAADHNRQKVQRRSTSLTVCTREMPPRHLSKSDSLPTTGSRLQIGLMPVRTRTVQPQRFRLALLTSRQPTVPRIKQLPQAPHSNNHSVDQYHCWSTQKRRLRTFNDRQHNLRRLAADVEFRQGWRGPHPSHHSGRSSTSSRNTLPLE